MFDTETWLKIIGGLVALLHGGAVYMVMLYVDNRKAIEKVRNDSISISQFDKLEKRLDKQDDEIKEMHTREIEAIRQEIVKSREDARKDMNGISINLTAHINRVEETLKTFIQSNEKHQEQVTQLILRIAG